MNLQRIKNLCEDKRIEVKRLAREIGMSETNFHKCIRDNEIKAGALERVARVLNVSVLEFFDENNKIEFREANRDYYENNGQVYNGDMNLQREIDHLTQRLADKQEVIDSLRAQIENLKLK